LARLVVKTEGARLEGLFTHFARADEADRTTTDQQLKTFNQVVDGLQQAGLRPPLVHAANSAATLSLARSHFDLVRLGIAMYGLHPSAHCRLPDGFRPALSWRAQLSQVKLLPPVRGVSYGHAYVTQAEERIGTVPVGYADGFRRLAGNQALVRGLRVPVVGRVCMDQSMLQLDAVPGAREGEEVVLLGHQLGEAIHAEELAERWGTINYEVTCGIGRRVPRLYG
jgi:alanine racemase